jgi:transcriptional repressor NrdR
VICPDCDAPTHVLESRRSEDGAGVRRRRECTECGRRFTTQERPQPEPLRVIKRNGERQRFDRDKLRRALGRAAHKRPVSDSELDSIAESVEAAAVAAGDEIEARRIGRLCLIRLAELDRGAYLQFAGTLPPDEAEAAEFADPAPERSVRLAGEDAELPLQPASRRGSDE